MRGLFEELCVGQAAVLGLADAVLNAGVAAVFKVEMGDALAFLVLTDSQDGDGGATEDGDEGTERPNDQTTKVQTCVRVSASSVPHMEGRLSRG
jgi:hypothetical protein